MPTDNQKNNQTSSKRGDKDADHNLGLRHEAGQGNRDALEFNVAEDLRGQNEEEGMKKLPDTLVAPAGIVKTPEVRRYKEGVVSPDKPPPSRRVANRRKQSDEKEEERQRVIAEGVSSFFYTHYVIYWVFFCCHFWIAKPSIGPVFLAPFVGILTGWILPSIMIMLAIFGLRKISKYFMHSQGLTRTEASSVFAYTIFSFFIIYAGVAFGFQQKYGLVIFVSTPYFLETVPLMFLATLCGLKISSGYESKVIIPIALVFSVYGALVGKLGLFLYLFPWA